MKELEMMLSKFVELIKFLNLFRIEIRHWRFNSCIQWTLIFFSQIQKIDGVYFFVDAAANAFETINRPAALWNSNARVLWPRCSKLLVQKRTFSCEGETQGDPLAMHLYGLPVFNLPLIRKLKNPAKCKQNWYTDDSACSAPLIWHWF